jgi:transcriptional regulator with XRE-family HTH domain
MNQTNDKKNIKKAIGARLRVIRKHLQLTQVEIVENFDCGRANYSRMEKGEIFPSPTLLMALYVKFYVSLNWLIAGDGEMFREQEKIEKKPLQCPLKKLILSFDCQPATK